MKVYELNILWGFKSLRNGIFTVKFNIIFQSSSLTIEQYCKQHYSRVLERNGPAFNIEELKKLYEMRLYIKKASKNEVKDIATYLYNTQWFGDVPNNSKYFSITIEEYDCRNILNESLPYLAYSGYITFNMNEMFNYYVDKGYVQVIYRDNQFVKEVIYLTLFKSLPKILTTDSAYIAKDELLQIISNSLNKRTKLLTIIEKRLKIKNLQNYKKEVTWISDNKFKIVINDYVKIIKHKIKQNIIPFTLAGLYFYNKHKKKKEEIATIKTKLNVFEKMLDITKKEIQKEATQKIKEKQRELFGIKKSPWQIK